MTPLKGDPSALRAHNRRVILNHLRRLGPISRTQLVELTGLSSASITSITADLIQERLLTERSIGEAGISGGRRPIYLDIDYTAHYAIGFKLREHRIEAVLTDLSTQILAHHTDTLDSHDPHHVTSHIHRVCKTLYRRARINPEGVIGIGIGLVGVIDALKGTVVNAPLLGWRDVPLSQLVQRRTGLPTHIDNDVNSLAAAERLFGHGKHTNHFLTIALGRGLGSALVLNGDLHRGRQGGAGEFGHNIITPNGRRCSCGRHGCLEAYTAEPALLAQLHERHPDLTERITTIDALVTLADQGHASATDVLSTAGRLLGTHLSYLVNTLNPELIIIAGEGTRLGPHYFEPLRDAIHTNAFDGLAHDLPLIIDTWPNDDFTLWARGAASLAVQCAFDFGTLLKGTNLTHPS
ncbi:ROK family transcriptional regulator [Deinococcus yavapaiensis]|uniref:Putative NBD/HSP70 family sugar kinase n=1 Tax=Deinococcus yavapaiensis KR-236 TaxID=694435 RepID=A0A318S3R8_9DEIO|nr:ROK family transcriptional regulator [Deinococcus yavapaiensis]PYE51009.1 putative NBD/HSP70 family sugar kinase [Deinococcus yavapaiensis KR-236]